MVRAGNVATLQGESRLTVYDAGTGGLLGERADKATLYTRTGWRWAQLEQSVPAVEGDRFIWLVAQILTLTGSELPQFLTAGG